MSNVTECLYRTEDGWIFNPTIKQALTVAEQAHISSGFWGRMEVTESMVAHVLAGHCIVQDSVMQLKPESEWDENKEDDDDSNS